MWSYVVPGGVRVGDALLLALGDGVTFGRPRRRCRKRAGARTRHMHTGDRAEEHCRHRTEQTEREFLFAAAAASAGDAGAVAASGPSCSARRRTLCLSSSRRAGGRCWEEAIDDARRAASCWLALFYGFLRGGRRGWIDRGRPRDKGSRPTTATRRCRIDGRGTRGG